MQYFKRNKKNWKYTHTVVLKVLKGFKLQKVQIQANMLKKNQCITSNNSNLTSLTQF
jgi:hypothetical protein